MKLFTVHGFTLVELLVVMAIFTLLSSFATINLLRPQTKAAVDTTTSTLIADLRQQQLKAMMGDTEGGNMPNPYGIYFEANRYVLFPQESYDEANQNNFSVAVEPPLSLTNISFPNSQVAFMRLSGEVSNFVSGANRLTVVNSVTAEQKTISINRYGAIDIE